MNDNGPSAYDSTRELYGDVGAFAYAMSEAHKIIKLGKFYDELISLDNRPILKKLAILQARTMKMGGMDYNDTIEELRKYGEVPIVAQVLEEVESAVSNLERIANLEL